MEHIHRLPLLLFRSFLKAAVPLAAPTLPGCPKTYPNFLPIELLHY